MSSDAELAPQVMVFDGVTGSGKTTALAYIRELCTATVRIGHVWTQRSRRQDDPEWEHIFVDDIGTTGNLRKYESVGNHYAIDMNEVAETVRTGLCYVVSCADYDLVAELRSCYRTRFVFVYRPVTARGVEQLLLKRHGVRPPDTKARVADTRLMLDEYAGAIGLFDCVILNVGSLTDLHAQVRALLSVYHLLPIV
jgi:hypothetical protein